MVFNQNTVVNIFIHISICNKFDAVLGNTFWCYLGQHEKEPIKCL